MSKPAPKRDIQWADGIRGIACFLVVIAHGFQGFGMPETSFDVPFPFALPIFRLFLHGGFLAVAIFFIMSGYVCSIKPLKLARAGKADEARKVIASSAFRRVVRLSIPAGIATTMSWWLANVGAYNFAHSLPGHCWLNFHSAYGDADWSIAIEELIKAILHTWTYDGQIWNTGRNRFELIQWTLAIELRGSFLVYLALIITASFTPSARVATFSFLIAYAIYGGDLLGEIPFFTGALLADLSIVLSSSSNDFLSTTSSKPLLGRYHKYWPMTLGIIALLIASYPSNNAELAGWSRFMIRMGNRFLHPDWEHRWAFSLIGGILLIYAIHYSPLLRRIFSWRPAVFFGSISFPVYLIHSFVMRTVLVWVVYGLIPSTPGLVRYTLNTIAFLGYLALIVYLSVLWNKKIDYNCGVFTAWLEDVMLGKRSVLGVLVNLQEKGVLPAGAIHINGSTTSLEDGIKEKMPQAVA